jgi:polysaccharide biosynthesis/export protein
MLRNFLKKLMISFVVLAFGFAINSYAADENNYLLGIGDLLKINVYNNPDLSLEVRVGEKGMIRFPLIGEVQVDGMTTRAAENKIAHQLETGGYLKQPQINILVTQYQSKMISVLGSVLRPGRYPLEHPTSLSELLALAGGPTADGSDFVTITSKTGKTDLDLNNIVSKGDDAQNLQLQGGELVFVHSRDVSVIGQFNRPGKYAITAGVRTLGDFISVAGGISPTGSDTITVTTTRNGKPKRYEIDIDTLFRTGGMAANIELVSGDTVYVPRAPMVYIYGEVQRPGSFRIERNMSVIQALAQAGGLTPKGTQRNIRLERRDANGNVQKLTPALNDLVQQDDVLYVQESLF